MKPITTELPVWGMSLESLEARVLMSSYDIAGVYEAALDLPRINAMLRRTPTGAPLVSDFAPIINHDLNAPPFLAAILDTGASGILLTNTAQEYWPIQKTAQVNGQDVKYSDVGVGGSEDFNVSEPLYLAVANNNSFTDADNPSDLSMYTHQIGPVRTQLSLPTEFSDPLADITSIIGMPAMQGKVVVIDPTPTSNQVASTYAKTYIYNPGEPFHPSTTSTNPGIPSTEFTIKLSYASFARFSQVTPSGAPSPVLAANPFIGPNPLSRIDPSVPPGNVPPIVFNNGLNSVSGSLLLDTGGSVSILSRALASQLGINYVDGTFGTDRPLLTNVAAGQQFQLAIGGVGGTTVMAGCFIDSMDIPTGNGNFIHFDGAPFLIGDISVADPVTNQVLTLDGIFGMNYIMGTAATSFDPISGQTSVVDYADNAWDWAVFDEPAGEFRLQPGERTLDPRVVDKLFDYNESPHAFYFQFNRNVTATISIADLVFKNLTTNTTFANSDLQFVYDGTVNTGTLKFPNAPNRVLPDGNYRFTVKKDGVTDIGGNTMLEDYVYDFHFLTADGNYDRTVSSPDFNLLVSHFGQEDGSEEVVGFSRGDYNYDGTVDTIDFNLLMKKFGTTLAPSPGSLPTEATVGSLVSLRLQPNLATTFAKIRIDGIGLLDDRTDGALPA